MAGGIGACGGGAFRSPRLSGCVCGGGTYSCAGSGAAGACAIIGSGSSFAGCGASCVRSGMIFSIGGRSGAATATVTGGSFFAGEDFAAATSAAASFAATTLGFAVVRVDTPAIVVPQFV